MSEGRHRPQTRRRESLDGKSDPCSEQATYTLTDPATPPSTNSPVPIHPSTHPPSIHPPSTLLSMIYNQSIDLSIQQIFSEVHQEPDPGDCTVTLVSSPNEGDFLLRMLRHNHVCKTSGTEQAQSRSLTHRWARTLQSSAPCYFPFLLNRKKSKRRWRPSFVQGELRSAEDGGEEKGRAQRVVWAQPPIGRVSPLKSSKRGDLLCPLYRGMWCPLLRGRAETRPGALSAAPLLPLLRLASMMAELALVGPQRWQVLTLQAVNMYQPCLA